MRGHFSITCSTVDKWFAEEERLVRNNQDHPPENNFNDIIRSVSERVWKYNRTYFFSVQEKNVFRKTTGSITLKF